MPTILGNEMKKKGCFLTQVLQQLKVRVGILVWWSLFLNIFSGWHLFAFSVLGRFGLVRRQFRKVGGKYGKQQNLCKGGFHFFTKWLFHPTQHTEPQRKPLCSQKSFGVIKANLNRKSLCSKPAFYFTSKGLVG